MRIVGFIREYHFVLYYYVWRRRWWVFRRHWSTKFKASGRDASLRDHHRLDEERKEGKKEKDRQLGSVGLNAAAAATASNDAKFGARRGRYDEKEEKGEEYEEEKSAKEGGLREK